MTAHTKYQSPFAGDYSLSLPESGEVNIYSLHLPHPLDDLIPAADEIEYFLLPDELKRYERYLLQKKKTEFFLARKFIKGLLAGMLHKSCRQLALLPDSTGKPFLFVDQEPFPLYFNLSHTEGLISCVISKYKETGIDVECLGGSRDDLVDRFFHPQEISEYAALDKKDREERFCTLWTLKEAYLKATAQGLYTPLDSFCFSLPSAGCPTENIHIRLSDEKEQIATDFFRFFCSRPTVKHFLAMAGKIKKNVVFSEHHFVLSDDHSFFTRCIPHPDHTTI